MVSVADLHQQPCKTRWCQKLETWGIGTATIEVRGVGLINYQIISDVRHGAGHGSI
jgi:hypothetical protein